MPRPPKDHGQPRSVRYDLRVAPDRLERWRGAAQQAGLSLADWLHVAAEQLADAPVCQACRDDASTGEPHARCEWCEAPLCLPCAERGVRRCEACEAA